MTNVWVICRKELRSYFASPIAYAVMALFALIFGIWFYLFTRQFVNESFRAQMSGGGPPMSVNEYIIRPILGFAGTISLFLIPLISMRLIAEEKRNGTMELLLTSPIQDLSIILGKWMGAMLLYLCLLEYLKFCYISAYLLVVPLIQKHNTSGVCESTRVILSYRDLRYNLLHL